MATMSLYRERAEHYDRIYHFKDYADESERLCRLLAERGVESGARVVEAACGTGSYLVHLRERYRTAGFDLHDEMLAVARRKLAGSGPFGETRLWQADMTSFVLGEPADALLCLFSSIAYVHPQERLLAAARCFHQALRPGGVLVVEPFVTPDAYRDGHASLQTYPGDDVKLARACVGRLAGALAVLDFHWLAATPHVGVEAWTERHELWLSTRQQLVAPFVQAGFETEFTEDGLLPQRGLLLATRPR